MAKKRKKVDYRPGTPAGDAYLDRQDRARKRRGFKGRTLGGQRTTARSYGSKLGKRKRSK